MLHRAILTKFLTPWYLYRGAIPIFKKILSRKNGSHFEFSNFFAKNAKHKNTYMSKIVLDRVILTKFLTQFKKNGSFEFSNFSQNCKTQKCLYRKAVLDRLISTKFLTHRVSLQSSHLNFQNIFVSPKMVAILNFLIFHKKCKTQKCLYLENRAR